MNELTQATQSAVLCQCGGFNWIDAAGRTAIGQECRMDGVVMRGI